MAIVGILGLLLMLALVGLLPVGIVLIVRSGRNRLPYPSCGKCGYDLTGFSTNSDACPECGVRYTEAGILPAQPGRRKGMFAWGIVMVVLPLVLGGFIFIASLFVVRSAQSRARAAQQQALTLSLQQQATTLAADLKAMQTERRQTTDEVRAAELDQSILELRDQLTATQQQLDVIESQQGGN